MDLNSQEYPPNARRILNEIMMLLFTPEAAMGASITADRAGALVAQFANAAKSDVSLVKSLLSILVNHLESLENRIEQREIEESNREFKAMLEAQEKRQRTMESIRVSD